MNEFYSNMTKLILYRISINCYIRFELLPTHATVQFPIRFSTTNQKKKHPICPRTRYYTLIGPGIVSSASVHQTVVVVEEIAFVHSAGAHTRTRKTFQTEFLMASRTAHTRPPPSRGNIRQTNRQSNFHFPEPFSAELQTPGGGGGSKAAKVGSWKNGDYLPPWHQFFLLLLLEVHQVKCFPFFFVRAS